MKNLLLKLSRYNVRFTLYFCFLICLWIACNKKDYIDCSGIGNYQNLTFNHDIGVLTDSSLSIFPNNLPVSVSFKSNFSQSNILEKGDLQRGKNTWTYHTEMEKTPCYEFKKIYNKSVPYETVNLVPISQPNFHHIYTRTRYIEFQNYQNINSKIILDSTYEIVTITLRAPLNSYTFIVPMGDVRNKLSNYTYFDTISISGVSFNNIYHIYADSAYYNTNKIVPQGIYYNQNEGLVGYYLSNGELWIKQ